MAEVRSFMPGHKKPLLVLEPGSNLKEDSGGQMNLAVVPSQKTSTVIQDGWIHLRNE